MLKYFLLIALTTLALTQSLPCANATLKPIYAYAMTNTSNISLAVGYNVVVGRWDNPIANQSYVINVWGWNSFNGSLIEAFFNAANVSQIRPSVAYGERGVLMSAFNANKSFLFAQKDTSNSNFQIQVTALQSAYNSSFGFTISLYQGGYNNYYNNTCEQTCNGTVAFASVNGTQYPTQFTCRYNEE